MLVRLTIECVHLLCFCVISYRFGDFCSFPYYVGLRHNVNEILVDSV